ncbi:MAG TPA: hypothetical protein VIK91_17445 [Nannocystis sp.]
MGVPEDFQERVGAYLGTCDPRVLRRAGEAFRGVWASEHEYVVDQIAEHLPPFLAWILACCDPNALRRGYEAGKLRVWSIPLDAGRCMVFESFRDDVLLARRAFAALDVDDEGPETPCGVCGAEDWKVLVYDYEGAPIGCDRCEFGRQPGGARVTG